MQSNIVREIALREAAAVCMRNADAIDEAIASGVVANRFNQWWLLAKADQARANHYAILALLNRPQGPEGDE